MTHATKSPTTNGAAHGLIRATGANDGCKPPAGAGLLRAPDDPSPDGVPPLLNSAAGGVSKTSPSAAVFSVGHPMNSAFLGWTEAAIARLTELWEAGKTASQIAAALGCTRNQVIGKAHRLELKPRPSPILRDRRVTLLQLEPHHCRWPEGHPGAPGFRFCGELQLAGSSYCAMHEAVARQPGTSFIETERRRKAAYRERATK